MFLSKRSNGIYYVVYEKDGKRYHRSTRFKRKSEANIFLQNFNEILLKNKTAKQKKLLDDFIEEYLHYSTTIHRPNSTESCKSALREFRKYVGNCFISTIDLKSVQSFTLNKLKETSAINTRRYQVTLGSIFEVAKKWGYVETNPFKLVKKIKLPDLVPCYFSKDELHKLFSEIHDLDFKDIVTVAVLTGLRISELTQLSWKHIDLDKQIIHILNTDTFTTKSKRNRSLPINDQLLKVLQNRKYFSNHELVFSKDDKPYRHEYISKRFKEYVNKANLNSKLHFHSLRHTFASWLVQCGSSLYEVQKLLGHSDTRTVQIYAHLQPDQLHSTVNKLSI